MTAAALESILPVAVIVAAALGIAWLESPAQRSRRRRRDARARIAVRQQLHSGRDGHRGSA